MNSAFEFSIEISEPYDFSKKNLTEIVQNVWVHNQWPLVYFIFSDNSKAAYVGESTNFSKRIENHLNNSEKSKLNRLTIIGSDKFNKSATLDIESKLIQYLTGEGTFDLLNGNFGLINHNYYQQDIYSNLFSEIWNKLLERKIVSKSLQEIENSELFKYSPYKSLSEDQYNSVVELLENITNSNSSKIFVRGSAGTGKTILATYLLKLLHSNINLISRDDLNVNERYELELLEKFKSKYPEPKIAIVVAMTSLRTSLKKVFSKIPDLKASMVISPSDSFKKEYDLLIVDEAHRLRQYKSIGWRGAFKKNNQKLGLDDSGTELDWVIANSRNQIFFYDQAQSVKPSDIDNDRFNTIIESPGVVEVELKSQMRCLGGNDYISFIDRLLKCNLRNERFESKKYDLQYFDSFSYLYDRLKENEKSIGLCRLIAGYSWEWKSDPKKKTPNLNAIDIEIDGLKFQWNRTAEDWINSDSAFNEVGCIHTTQGYDLNYAGIIFGKEIDYDPINNKIVVYKDQYYDKYGKIGANSDEALKEYIVNIYKTILYRGIKGAYVYACNENLKIYLKSKLTNAVAVNEPRAIRKAYLKPYVNAVPKYDIAIAAGNFSEEQIADEFDWVELPMRYSASEKYFVCKVVGESMNKKIPNGSWCLFEKYSGGPRNELIVLAQHSSFNEMHFGSGYTVKRYSSEKSISSENWEHESIVLSPMSSEKHFKSITLNKDDMSDFKILGIFKAVLEY